MPTRPDLARLVDVLVQAFFREIEVTGVDQVPTDRGGILVAWHPNGMVDPALIISAFPRRVVFGARDGLFRVPVLGTLMRKMGTVPIRRAMDSERMDAEARRAANRASLEQLAREVAEGSFAALFPEGVSHDASRPVELKTGAARLFFLARELTPAYRPPPVIVPVGLFYDRKNRFRSRALVEFHPPLVLPAGMSDARELTLLIQKTLHDVVDATEDWSTHDVLQRGRKILHAHAEGGRELSLREETAAFAAIRAAYYRLLDSNPDELALLRRDVDRYDRDLKALGLEDGDLDRDPRLLSRSQLMLVLSQALLVYFLLPPLLILGFVVNAPIALAIRGLAFVAGKLKKDQASIKVLAGAVLFPLAWIGAGVGGYLWHTQIDAQYRLMPHTPVLAGFVLGFLSIVGGAIALIYLEFARATARAVRVRLTRFQRVRTLARLQLERARLAHAMLALADAGASSRPGPASP